MVGTQGKQHTAVMHNGIVALKSHTVKKVGHTIAAQRHTGLFSVNAPAWIQLLSGGFVKEKESHFTCSCPRSNSNLLAFFQRLAFPLSEPGRRGLH